MYVTCILVLACTSQDEKLLCGYLRSIIVDMALYFAPVDSLTASLSELKRERKLHIIVLGVLQELANHSSFQVRRYVATLYGVHKFVFAFSIHVGKGAINISFGSIDLLILSRNEM